MKWPKRLLSPGLIRWIWRPKSRPWHHLTDARSIRTGASRSGRNRRTANRVPRGTVCSPSILVPVLERSTKLPLPRKFDPRKYTGQSTRKRLCERMRKRIAIYDLSRKAGVGGRVPCRDMAPEAGRSIVCRDGKYHASFQGAPLLSEGWMACLGPDRPLLRPEPDEGRTLWAKSKSTRERKSPRRRPAYASRSVGRPLRCT